MGFSVTFDYDITNGTSPYYADGFSFNIGNYDMDYISRLGTAPPVEGDPIVPVGEMGIYESDYSDSMLSVAFDTYGTDSGVRVLYNGVSIASTTSADPLSFDTIGIALDETGQLTVSEGETQIFDINVADYYIPSSSNIIAFSARTGGEDEVVTLDNIQYTSAAPVPEPASMLLLGVGGAAVAVVRKRKQMLELV